MRYFLISNFADDSGSMLSVDNIYFNDSGWVTFLNDDNSLALALSPGFSGSIIEVTEVDYERMVKGDDEDEEV